MPLFTRQLKIGDKGEDVRRLQIFLNTHGCSVAKKGAGSPGKETVLFGPALKAAIVRCQQANAAALLAPAKLKKRNRYLWRPYARLG